MAEIMEANIENESECSERECVLTVHELVTKGEFEKATQVCEQEPYSHISKCQEYLVWCQEQLGWSYYEKDELKTSYKWFLEAKRKGSAEAIFGIASIDYKTQQFEKALSGFELAAESGFGRACHWVGNIYREGLGVDVDYPKAMHWYKRGADLGYLFAERYLIYLKWKNGNLIVKSMMIPKFMSLLFRGGCIARKNINDIRLIDFRKSSQNFLKKHQK